MYTLTKCPYSLRNPCCLTCIRAYFINKIENGFKLRCPTNCCKSEHPLNNEIFRLYGEVLRKKDEPADLYNWNILFNCGILNKICPRCNIECTDLESVINHNQKVCLDRLIPCKGCDELVKYREIHNHIEEYIENNDGSHPPCRFKIYT